MYGLVKILSVIIIIDIDDGNYVCVYFYTSMKINWYHVYMIYKYVNLYIHYEYIHIYWP